MTRETSTMSSLIKLDDAGPTLQDPALDDIRGFDLYDNEGQQLGTVEDLYVDEEEHRVRFLDVAAGGFLGLGEKHFLIPVEAVKEVSERNVVVDHDREKVSGSPPFDTSVPPQRSTYEDIYQYYGYARSGGRAGPGAWPGGI